jgi:ABC-type antimicrobial peptide transport system permease subunit
MATRLWGSTDVIGRTFRAGREGPVVRIVGVARTAKYRFLTEPPLPVFWVPLAQSYRASLTLHLQTNGSPSELAAQARALVAALDPELPVYDVRPLHDHLYQGHAFLPTKLGRSLSAMFGALALSLALVGLYGVVAYSVSRRTREIGIRMALGARLSAVLGMFVREGLIIAGIGTAVGVLVALLAGRAIRGLLIGISPSDPAMVAGAAAVLLACAATASWIPARRAARVDPASTLRGE